MCFFAWSPSCVLQIQRSLHNLLFSLWSANHWSTLCTRQSMDWLDPHFLHDIIIYTLILASLYTYRDQKHQLINSVSLMAWVTFAFAECSIGVTVWWQELFDVFWSCQWTTRLAGLGGEERGNWLGPSGLNCPSPVMWQAVLSPLPMGWCQYCQIRFISRIVLTMDVHNQKLERLPSTRLLSSQWVYCCSGSCFHIPVSSKLKVDETCPSLQAAKLWAKLVWKCVGVAFCLARLPHPFTFMRVGLSFET